MYPQTKSPRSGSAIDNSGGMPISDKPSEVSQEGIALNDELRTLDESVMQLSSRLSQVLRMATTAAADGGGEKNPDFDMRCPLAQSLSETRRRVAGIQQVINDLHSRLAI